MKKITIKQAIKSAAYHMEKAKIFITIIISMLIITYPLTTSHAWIGDDVGAHINRLLVSIDTKQTIPYFDFSNETSPGYSWNLFYPPLSTFLMYIAYLFNPSELDRTIKTTAIFIIALCYLSTFISCKKYNSTQCSLLVAAIYSSSSYLATNLYTRFAFPEATAMIFAPILISGFIDFSKGEVNKKIPLSMALILLSNIPSFLCACFFSMLCCVTIKPDINQLKTLFKYALSAMCLSAFFLIPMLYEQINDQIQMGETIWFDAMKSAIVRIDDFLLGLTIQSGRLTGMLICIGAPLMAAFLISLRHWKSEDTWLLITLFLMICFVTFPINYLIFPSWLAIFSNIQFPWRITPYILSCVLFTIIRNEKNITILCLALFTSSLLTSSITFEKKKTPLNQKDFLQTVYMDYILLGSEFKKGLKKVTCTINDQQTDYMAGRILNEKGMPVFTFQADSDAECQIPVMAYSALRANGEHRSTHGYFTYSAKKGENVVEVSTSKNFNYLVGLSIMLSLLTSVFMLFSPRFFFKSHLFKKDRENMLSH